MHSTSSQSSSMSRPRTKAALKGYDSLEMTLQPPRIEIQHTVDRSPTSSACKLAALADIALSNPLGLLEPPQPTVYEHKDSPKASRMSVSPAKTSVKQSPSLLMSSECIKAHSMEFKTKSFDASYTGTPKHRKRARQSSGKRTGYKEKKKKSRREKSTERAAVDSSKPKDVYDFEESHDSVEDEIIPLTHTRPSKTEPQANVDAKPRTLPVESVPNDEPEDESSYSDRDDYYNFNSVSCSGTEDTQETPITNDDAKSDHDTKSSSLSPDKKPSSSTNTKNLIMGRIFKNCTKKESPSTATPEHKKPIQKPIPDNELDEIFDYLKNKDSDVAKQSPTIERKIKTPKKERKAKTAIDTSTSIEKAHSKKKKPSKAARKVHKEQSSPKSEQSGRGKESPKRKTQRRCATNRQNKFVETWSSDEYEEFHTTKDIIALIQEAEMKEQRSKEKTAKQQAENESAAKGLVKTKSLSNESNVAKSTKKEKRKKSSDRGDGAAKKSKSSKVAEKSVEKLAKHKVKKAPSAKFESEDDSDFDEHWNKSAKRAKNRKRRQTISSRPDDIPEEKSKKPKEKPEKPHKSRKSTKKTAPEEPKPTAGPSTEKKKSSKGSKKHRDGSKSSGKTKAGDRKKRMASDTLYYWSSSSDEEFGRVEKNIDNRNDDNREKQLEQHGWIVGDSHKKLVTLLAHGKGKKHDDGAVKETVHKRK